VPKYSDFKAVIFDVDDTLLDNKPRDPLRRLHARSRLAAVQQVGTRRGIQELQNLSQQDNLAAWRQSRVHSIEGAAWAILFNAGLVNGQDIDYGNEIVHEISALKHKLHEKILREEGEAVPGAPAFVRSLAAHGFEGKLAIASTAIRQEIHIFLEKVGLESFFPNKRIISKEQVRHVKPHPEAFELAFQTFGLSPEDKQRILVFEDDPRGIMAGKAAGMFVCAITTAFDSEDLAKLAVPPDLIADSYAEFAKILGLPLLASGRD
jgi:HAD superfamily hydrolase (TIGR01509 family)